MDKLLTDRAALILPGAVNILTAKNNIKIKANQRNGELLRINEIMKSWITELDMSNILKEKPALKKDCI